jgi:hypothetical protein
MKNFKFDHDNKQWDRYNAFHATEYNFVEFETGEVMVIGEPDPWSRRFYPKYNVQLVTTTDKDCPVLYFDKECTEPVKKAWVSHHGQQHLAIDYEQCVATTYYTGYNRNNIVLGEHVRQASVYWAGGKRLPSVLQKIKVQTPDPRFKTKKTRQTLGEALITVSALWRIQAGEDTSWWNETKYLAKEEWHDSSVEEIVGEIIADPDSMKSVATVGFEYPRVTQEVDFLYVKPRGE